MPAARFGKTPRLVCHSLVIIGSAAAGMGTVHALINRSRLRRPPHNPSPVTAAVSLLVPARDEAHRIAPTIRSLLAQHNLVDAEILVLDDGSTDGTADVVLDAAGSDPRLQVLTGTPPPPGWLGKPHACAQLAAAAHGEILVYVDADVVLEPHAVAAAVAVLRGPDPLDLLCPWPRQIAAGWAGRLVQPLLAWSWLTTLPVRRAEASRRASMAVANGQFLLVDAEALADAGGWQSVSGAVLDDIALARAVRATGGRTGIADGSALATCRMYASGSELRDGYRKSLWAAFGSPAGALAVAAALTVVYLLPGAAALAGSRIGALGYLAAVAGRITARRWCATPSPCDAGAHPLSVLALLALMASSFYGKAAGSLHWKGRPL